MHKNISLKHPNCPNYSQEIVMFLSYITARIRSYMRYRASVRALSALSERELSDIGLTRGDIQDVARGTAAA